MVCCIQKPISSILAFSPGLHKKTIADSTDNPNDTIVFTWAQWCSKLGLNSIDDFSGSNSDYLAERVAKSGVNMPKFFITIGNFEPDYLHDNTVDYKDSLIKLRYNVTFKNFDQHHNYHNFNTALTLRLGLLACQIAG